MPTMPGLATIDDGSAANVSFRLCVPDGAGSHTLRGRISPAVELSQVTVTIDISLVAATNPLTVVSRIVKTAQVDSEGRAVFNIEGLPTMTVLAKMQINNGNFGGFSRFRGAADLKSGNNFVDLGAEGQKSPADLLANTIEAFVSSKTVLPTTVTAIVTTFSDVVNDISTNDTSAYDLCLDRILEPDTVPPVIQNLVFSAISRNSFKVSFTTNRAASAVLQYGISAALGKTLSKASATAHEFQIDSFTGPRFYLRLAIKDAQSLEHVLTRDFSTLNEVVFPDTYSTTGAKLTTFSLIIRIRKVPATFDTTALLACGKVAPYTDKRWSKLPYSTLTDGIELVFSDEAGVFDVAEFSRISLTGNLPRGAEVELYSRETKAVLASVTIP